jgi:hypothetical protein
MKTLLFAGTLTLFVAGPALAGSNLAWNDCFGGGGMTDLTVACTNTGSAFAYVSLNPSQSYPKVGATDVFFVVTPATAIGTWWNPAATTTRWGSSITEPISGACPAWWAAAPNGGITFQPPQAYLSSFGRMVLRITTVVGAGEEQPMQPGTEYFLGALELKFSSGTADNPECIGGANIDVGEPCSGMGCLDSPAHIEILQPGFPDFSERDPDVSNCVTFRNPPTRQCPGATPTQKSTWGSIKALYR